MSTELGRFVRLACLFAFVAGFAAVPLKSAAAQETAAGSPGESPRVEGEMRDLHAWYEESGRDLQPGVYQAGNAVVAISVLDAADARDARNEALALMECRALLQQHAMSRMGDLSERLADNPLRDGFPELAKAVRSVRPGFSWVTMALNDLPAQYLEKRGIQDGKYRLALAVDSAALLKAAGDGFSSAGWEETADLFREAWNEIGGDAPSDEVIQDLSLYCDWIKTGRETVPPSFNLNAYPDAPVDDPWLAHAAWRRVEGMVETEDASASEIGRVLDGLPAGPEALRWRARRAASDGIANEAALLWLLSARFGSSEDANAARAGAIDALPLGEGAEELAGLLRAHGEAVMPDFLGEFDSSPLSAVWCSYGFLGFPGRYSAARASGLEEAGALFREGRELEKIILLSARSAAENPRCSESWRLLGHAMVVFGQASPAIPFLHQAVVIDGRNAMNRVTLALAYQQAGAPILAKGMAASALACHGGDAWATEKALAVLRAVAGD